MRTIRCILSVLVGIATFPLIYLTAAYVMISGFETTRVAFDTDGEPVDKLQASWGLAQIVLGWEVVGGIVAIIGFGLAFLIWPRERYSRVRSGPNRPIGQTVPWMDRHGYQRPL